MSDGPRSALDDLISALASGRCRCQGRLAGSTRVDPAWCFRDRVLAEQLIYLPVRGACRWRTIHGERVIGDGDLLWIPPGLRHDTWLAAGAGGMTLYHFRFRVWDGAREVAPTGQMIVPGCTGLRDICDRWVREQRRADTTLAARLGALILLLACAVREQAARRDRPGHLRAEQVRRIEDHVRSHLRADSADLAALLGLGREHFVRLFTRTHGVSPRTWLKDQRLEQARIQLRTTAFKVGVVAERLGWRSSQLFSRQYRQRFGVSPGQDR